MPPSATPEPRAKPTPHAGSTGSGDGAASEPPFLAGEVALPADLGAVAEAVGREVERRVAALLEEHRRTQAEPAPLWDVASVAKRLGVSPRTVEKLIALGELTPLRIGGQRRFDPRTVEAYVKRCAEPQGPGASPSKGRG